jgi:hypothetical protein
MQVSGVRCQLLIIEGFRIQGSRFKVEGSKVQGFKDSGFKVAVHLFLIPVFCFLNPQSGQSAIG